MKVSIRDVKKLKELESKVRNFPKARTEQAIKMYALRIREYFFNFFLNDLLDYKNQKYAHDELFLNSTRRKKLPKDHYDFIARFAKTPSFKVFKKRTQKCSTPEDRTYNALLDNFSKKGRDSESAKEEDMRQIIDVDSCVKRHSFDTLQEKYLMESKFLPIKLIITSHKMNDATYYRYTYINTYKKSNQ